ncbi:hypothetical protein P9B03_16910 [Metasolibacillus meyeri]|uniref:Uncharacterized protein n=1 Tax=Metasolibacillus meyeri TaxID=1071052 RepID=A0AAW9NW73_9BACL|nr:hypothetical protein [Metasolibacillus meyeri]MEC1180185.1 hypothetical protein [Metasolibacillus meyeri]
MSKNGMANLNLILCTVIFLNNLVAILLKTEVNKTSFTMSMMLGILLLISGIWFKWQVRNER